MPHARVAGRAASRTFALPALLALTVVLVSGCGTPVSVVPDGEQQRTTPSSTPVPAAPGATPDAESPADPATGDGAAVARRITDCLARWGLSERPAVPASTAAAEERTAALLLTQQYDETFTTCSAEAMATTAPAPGS